MCVLVRLAVGCDFECQQMGAEYRRYISGGLEPVSILEWVAPVAPGVAAAGVFGRVVTKGIPKALNISGRQFGIKLGRRARDLGIDPSDPKVRFQLRNRIQRIFSNADEVRTGTFRGQGPGGADGPVAFFRRGSDVVVTTPSGDFITFLPGGANNARFLAGEVVP